MHLSKIKIKNHGQPQISYPRYSSSRYILTNMCNCNQPTCRCKLLRFDMDCWRSHQCL